jgi:hypothetical protein
MNDPQNRATDWHIANSFKRPLFSAGLVNDLPGSIKIIDWQL